MPEAAKVFHQMLKLKVSPNEATYKTLGILVKKGGMNIDSEDKKHLNIVTICKQNRAQIRHNQI